MDKTQDLLAVLDIKKSASGFYSKSTMQAKRLYELGYTDLVEKLHCGRDGVTWDWKNGIENLAFRLRDEVADGKVKVANGDMSAWFVGLEMVEGYLEETGSWFMHRSQPIHWIIAALIAKEMEQKDAE